jgi:hypothetical protein
LDAGAPLIVCIYVVESLLVPLARSTAMRRVAAFVITAALCGCGFPSLNSHSENHSTAEMPKCCGCAGMEHCGKNPDGTTCCKMDDCKCREMTRR